MVFVDNTEVLCEEEKRLQEDRERTKYWKKWGPYVAERQWATVREDYSADGDAWSHFSHDMSRKRAYRWGEDGIAGVSDTHGLQNIAFAFWNGKDDFLKERLFGLSNPQGVHGESVKECHFHLDNTPTHSYMKFLYKYPQEKFPYEHLIEENARRNKTEREYNLIDTDAFKDNKYWDIFIETAKETDDPDELLFRVTAYNRGPEAAQLHIIPHVWFRNTWAWGYDDTKPESKQVCEFACETNHKKLGKRYFQCSPSPNVGGLTEDIHPEFLFTDNDTNFKAIWGKDQKNKTEYTKDAFHRHIVNKEKDAVNPAKSGTKSAAWYAFDQGEGVPPGECAVVRFRISKKMAEGYIDEELFDDIMDQRLQEADEFYYRISPMPMNDDLRNIQRQALSGMMWCKQFYHFVWDQWANGDPGMPPPPPGRKAIRNSQWKHMHLDDILSMPDSWEYPFFAAWDSAFHCIPLTMIDPEFAKKQLDLFTREWYMHPNGQLPAYEWNFGDVNPPVHAWATFRTFKMERKMYGREDLDFLERVFQKLLLNFTWWVNRKDAEGKNVFEGGFLGLDNIGLFNRSDPLPTGGVLEQADSTGWMAFYCLCMLNIALELAKHRRTYEDIASKFFEHFVLISDAMQYRAGSEAKSLWNDEDGFYYDAISWGGPWTQQMPVRSLVGLIPMYACLTLEPQVINKLPQFKKRMEWFIENKHDVFERNIASMRRRGKDDRLLLSLVNEDRLKKILERMLDETEFLSKGGIRSLSKYHEKHPYSMDVNGQTFSVGYVPGDSDSGLFGGNSNWRGPVWIAVNFLLVESLLRFYMFYGNTLKVECPKGSGDMMHLGHVAEEIQHRLQHLMARGDDGRRAINDGNDMLDFDPHWKDYLWFYEFFDGDSGRGLGASHQCGWTGLMAKMIHDTGVNCRLPQTPRTPTAAASHYFDDVFTRQRRNSQTKKPSTLRRSSTSRSIGARSDYWKSAPPSDDGDHEGDHEAEEGDDTKSNGRAWTIYKDDGNTDARKEKESADDHVHKYVQDQLKRLMTPNGPEQYEDEIE
ncbi:family 63 glycoside hydrolase [Aureobasidium pullulans]|uniref:Mannosyl-oligosaccharide glucosidase n=1 Tax=Aureobasidium pullulans TaxID=5580 RepID=A0A4S9UFW1_AURPU|nr:family 63 glycoside hydrolase [Aureobasidium pullulans]THZ37334.1 family 63 glycoside hydrolase [Aureobasidium pullulans]THZ62653.1 family 63 glycoside hydrolase [Aureobasidium pullulans]THZ97412.1 family 63 glycoside hydrolase [Aureobasidium pullulans]